MKRFFAVSFQLAFASMATLVASVASADSVAAGAGSEEVVSFQPGARPPQGYARPPFHIKPSATTSTPKGLTPTQIRHAYGFDSLPNGGGGQTIAIIDAYDHPNIESDLGVFSSTFSLPACTKANGCFQKIYAAGSKPRTDVGWALEISLDVEWAHAIAPQAKILLVEAASSSFNDLLAAVDVAVKNGASVVSMSFGGSEFSSEPSYDSHFGGAGVTFLASSGDSGTGAEYPAASRYVVAVGGTTLGVDGAGNYINEAAWSGSGGGISTYETQPAGQYNFGVATSGKRGIPDVAYNADPNTGVPVYDSVKYQGQAGWFQVGGTSAGSPQWAGLMAIVNSLRAAQGKSTLSAGNDNVYAAALASYGSYFHDVLSGSNGTCGNLCNAVAGYDFVTGLGSPQAGSLIPALVSAP